MEPSLVGAKVYDRASKSVFEVGSSVCSMLGGPVSKVGSSEGGSFRDSWGSSSLSLDFYG